MSSVQDDPECSGNNSCNGAGVCKLKNGQGCGTDGTLCASGFCKDGVCCDSACTTQCHSCATGTCTDVISAEDNPECQGAYICDASGACKKKSGSCTVPGDCASSFCKDGACCNEACTAPCHTCTTGTCTDIIGADDNPECTGNNTCDGVGACKKDRGQTCAAGTECASTYCKDTKCCNTACTTACQTCNNATGTCTTVTSIEDAPECSATGMCNASGACKKYTGQGCTGDTQCLSGHCCSGFCRDWTSDAANCGACGAACTNAHGSGSICMSSACTAPTCTGGYDNCDGNNWNGCETSLYQINHCGGCSIICGTTAGYVYPHTTSYTCPSGACLVNACQANWYNLNDVSLSDGCECQDLDTGNKQCTLAQALGPVDDNAGVKSATGDIPKAGDVVWYSVQLANTHWDAAGGTNPFNAKIGFSANPGDEFQLQVYSDCATLAGCLTGAQPIHLTRPTDMWQWSASGESPCLLVPTPGLPALRGPHDDRLHQGLAPRRVRRELQQLHGAGDQRLLRRTA